MFEIHHTTKNVMYFPQILKLEIQYFHLQVIEGALNEFKFDDLINLSLIIFFGETL